MWDTAIRLAAWGPRALLLREALEIRYNETCRRVLILLDLLYPELAEERLRPSLLGEASRARAAALELLDLVLPHELLTVRPKPKSSHCVSTRMTFGN
jgi:hypothetical protein